MYVECFTNNRKPYLRLVQSVRITNEAGKKIPQKQVVFNVGPLDRFDDGQPGYVERLKKSFKAGAPLVPALEPYCHSARQAEDYRFSIKEGSPDCFGHPRLFSHVLLEHILEELGLNTFFSSYKGFTKLQYDVYGFAKLLFFVADRGNLQLPKPSPRNGRRKWVHCFKKPAEKHKEGNKNFHVGHKCRYILSKFCRSDKYWKNRIVTIKMESVWAPFLSSQVANSGSSTRVALI